MTEPLLTRRDRRVLTEKVIGYIADHACTALELASALRASLSAIHSVLVSLRSEGVIEPVGVFRPPDAPGGQVLWHVTDHGQLHGVRESLPGAPRCRSCRRIFEEW